MLPRLTTLIAQERARDPAALLLDAGDLGLRGATADLGVQLHRGLEYDAITPGNLWVSFDLSQPEGRRVRSLFMAIEPRPSGPRAAGRQLGHQGVP
jgi:hypothetical protein